MRFIIYIIICIVVSSCASLKEAGKVLRNEKQNTTDEFLVKKRTINYTPDLDGIPERDQLKKRYK